jgi:dUTP pyrophosphatase
MSTIKFKLLNENAKLPKRNHPFDAGLDLFCIQSVTIYPGQSALLPSGLSVAIPEGMGGFIWPRSGLAINNSLDTLAGLIDATYRGELKISLINHGERPVEFKVGDRIAQLVIQPVELLEPIEVRELDETERGAKGFGSSGI